MKLAHRRALATVGAAGLCATVLGVGGAAQAADPFTDPVTGTTSTYQVVNGGYNWNDANAAASATPAPEGCTSHLAVITSQAEQDYITDQVGSQPGLFIGAQRTEDHGPFAWVTGEAFDYANWNGGEPNDYGNGENYVQFANSGPTNSWNDIGGDYYTGYILETQCDAPTTPPTPGPLMVTGVDPTHGPGAGGNTATITGSGFTGATKVRFGSQTAPSYTVDSDTQITVTVPASTGTIGPKGQTVNVRVYVAKKKSAKVRADRYRYDAPVTNTDTNN